jgi:hypothetical protein
MSDAELEKAIREASPLALPELLLRVEFYEREEAISVIHRVYEEFANESNRLEAMAMTIIGGFVEGAIQPLNRKGLGNKNVRLSGEQIVSEICAYRKHLQVSGNEPSELPRDADYRQAAAPHDNRAFEKYDRNAVQDKGEMTRYKEKRFAGRRTANDEYGGTGKLRASQVIAKADRRIKAGNWKHHAAETDHVVPLKELDSRMKAFGYCDEATVKRIANMERNFALTDKSTNTSKGAKSVSEVLAHSEAMERKDKEARTAIGQEALKGGSYSVSISQVGKIIVSVIVPVGGEILDIILTGIRGVGLAAKSGVECILERLSRAAKYIMEHLRDIAGGFATEFVKMLLRLAVSMFTKFFDMVLAVVCQGIGFIVEGCKLLFAAPASMSRAQRAQAFVSLVGGSLVALLVDVVISGDGLFNDLLKAVLGGVAAAGLMYLLNKLDLFSEVAERRLARINEIFDARISDIKESTRLLDMTVSQKLKEQCLRFHELRNRIHEALDEQDYVNVNETLDGVADFFNVPIPYASPKEFVKMLQQDKPILIS